MVFSGAAHHQNLQIPNIKLQPIQNINHLFGNCNYFTCYIKLN